MPDRTAEEWKAIADQLAAALELCEPQMSGEGGFIDIDAYENAKKKRTEALAQYRRLK